MYIIVNKNNDSIHREPSKRSYASTQYKSEGAAKAGITRTVKFYQAAIDEVAEVVAEGKPEYHARRYNAFRDATDTDLGRTHVADRDNYRVMHVEEYALIMRNNSSCKYNWQYKVCSCDIIPTNCIVTWY